MKPRILLHPAFLSDLEAVIFYYEDHGFSVANRVKRSVYKTLDELALAPRQGSIKKYRSRNLRNIRSWRIRGFRKILILYRPLEDGIDVIALFHGARDIPSLLKQRLADPPN